MYPYGVELTKSLQVAQATNTSTSYHLLLTRKHRVWSPKHRLVRNIPETFKGLGLSQQTAFCPQKAMLASVVQNFTRQSLNTVYQYNIGILFFGILQIADILYLCIR